MSHERFDPRGAYGGSRFSNRELLGHEMEAIFAEEVNANIPPDYRVRVGYRCAETTCPNPPAMYVCFWNYNGKEPVE